VEFVDNTENIFISNIPSGNVLHSVQNKHKHSVSYQLNRYLVLFTKILFILSM